MIDVPCRGNARRHSSRAVSGAGAGLTFLSSTTALTCFPAHSGEKKIVKLHTNAADQTIDRMLRRLPRYSSTYTICSTMNASASAFTVPCGTARISARSTEAAKNENASEPFRCALYDRARSPSVWNPGSRGFGLSYSRAPLSLAGAIATNVRIMPREDTSRRWS